MGNRFICSRTLTEVSRPALYSSPRPTSPFLKKRSRCEGGARSSLRFVPHNCESRKGRGAPVCPPLSACNVLPITRGGQGGPPLHVYSRKNSAATVSLLSKEASPSNTYAQLRKASALQLA